MRLTSLLCTSLLLLVASCGGSDGSVNATLDSGYNSLNAGKHEEAIGHFEKALSSLKPGDTEYLGAKLGQLQSMAHVDAAKTKTLLMAVPKDSGIGPNDYRSIVTDLGDSAVTLATSGETEKAGATMGVAISILTEGQKTFPTYENWNMLIQVTGAKAEQLGDADSLTALKGLGYTGDE